MNKAQRANFRKYLDQSGAIVERFIENPDASLFGINGSPYYLSVRGGNLELTFRAASSFSDFQTTTITVSKAAPPFLPAHTTLGLENHNLDKGPKAVMGEYDKWADWTHIHVSRLTTSGGYRHTIKDEVIPRRADPLRALAAYFAAHQGQRPALMWTPDALERFAWTVAELQKETTFSPDNVMDIWVWGHFTNEQRQGVMDVKQAIDTVLPYLERGQQPPDDIAKAFADMRRRWKRLQAGPKTPEDAKVLDAVPPILTLSHEVTP